MKKLIALVLSVLMAISALPFAVFAEELHEHVAPTKENHADEIPVEETAPALSNVKAEATSGTTGDCIWYLEGTKLTISGNGAMEEYYSNYANEKFVTSAPWGSAITSVTIGNGVTSIGGCAFSGCDGLTSITIPNSVTSIGNYAFCDCSGLASITIPDSVTSIGSRAFYGCSRLTSIIIPDSVTFILDEAFDGCSGLTSITIGDGVTSIGDSAFSGCSSLTSITIPDSVTIIGDSAFSGCSGLTTVTIPDGVTTIGDCAFIFCSGLESITVEEGNPVYHSAGNCLIETESKTLVAGCKNSVIPSDDSVTSIGEGAFSDSGLTSITIPDSVITIGEGAFYGCSSLESIAVEEGNPVYHSAGNCLFETESKTLVAGCKNSVIPSDGSVTTIGDWAFSGCDRLTTITIPDGVTSIGNYAFYNCDGLTSINLPDTVTTIGDDAFNTYGSLKDVWYEGSEVDQSEISIDSDNECLTSAVWHYNSCMKNEGEWIHVYDNASDTACNLCGYEREVVICTTHTYDNAIDTTCNTCGEARTLPYDDYGTTGNCIWYLEGTKLTISGNGAMGSYDYYIGLKAPWGNLVTEAVIEDGVTCIGDDAFRCCSSLTTITIPDSVTSIGNWAFEYCESLATITIPDSVTSIGSSAFSGTSWFKNQPDGPDGIVYAGKVAYAVKGTCPSEIVLRDGTVAIADGVFNGCSFTTVTIPDSVTHIGDDAFLVCESLTSVTIPDSVTSIGDCAFYLCTALSDVWYTGSDHSGIEIGSFNDPLNTATWHYVDSVCDGECNECGATRTVHHVYDNASDTACNLCGYEREGLTGTTGDCTWTLVGTVLTISGNGAMGDYTQRDVNDFWVTTAPWGTLSVTKVIIENGVTSIDDSAFYGCTALRSITIPDSVTSISREAFEGCTALRSITIPDSVTSIGDFAFRDCTSLITITIPDSVTSIGSYAFDGCTSLSSITIPDSVTSIVEDAFWGCSSLTSITIPDSVTSIGRDAFYDCTGLTSITIPDSVTSIGWRAFDGCEYLKNVWYLGSRSSISGISIGEDNSYLTSATWHYLDSYCDDACNVCGEPYPNAHIFDHPCDPDCNLCDQARSVEHDFVYACGEICKKCNEIRVPDTDHTYRTVADTTCDVCGETRSLPFDAYGTTGACDWYVEGTVLTVVGSGAMGDYSPFSPSPWSKEITELRIENGVSVLGEDAFSGCTALTTVTIPQSVTKISDFAFDGCSALAHVWLVGDEASKDLITIGNGNTVLSSAAWYYDFCPKNEGTWTHVYDDDFDPACNLCGYEREVVTCTHTYDNAIDTDCNNCGATRTLPYDSYGTTGDCIWYLEGTKLTISGNGAMGDNGYSDPVWGTEITEVVIEEGVTSIGNRVFRFCNKLEVVKIPDTVSTIGNAAFSMCSALTSVSLPDSVKVIAPSAFHSCKSLTELPITPFVERIGSRAFVNCTGITSVALPKILTFIDYNAFEGCTALTDVWYEGSASDKAGIEIGIENDPLTAATWHYNSCVKNEGAWTHVYDNASDTACNLCGYEREVVTCTHTYDNAIDTTCNTCGEERTLPYDDYGTTGDCIWYLEGWYTEAPKLTISGNGAMADYNEANGPYRPWTSGFTKLVIEEGVTTIGMDAFCLSDLERVVIPDSVTTIKEGAFYSCDALVSVVLGEGVETIEYFAFAHCEALTDITIPDSVNMIEDGAFHVTCYDVQTHVWYEGSEADQSKILSGSSSNKLLTAATWHYNSCMKNEDTWTHVYDSDSDSVCNECGNERVISGTTGDCTWTLVGTKLTISGNGAMGDYNYSFSSPWGTDITEVIIEKGVTSIGEDAFFGCRGLTSVTIPDSVTSIGHEAFESCKSLTSITIPDGVTNIGEFAFAYCDDLTSITIPDSVTHIDFYAFQGCSSLISITIPDSVTYIDDSTFDGCSSLTSVTIPDGVTSIYSHAFFNCTALKDVWYEGSLTDRNAITIDSANTNLTSATWHYNSCMKNEGEWLHVYDNASDTACNLCGYEREVVTCTTHTYDNAIDTTCNTCGEARALPYDDYGTTGDCIWYLEGTKLTISGNGWMPEYGEDFVGPAPWWGVGITELVIERGVSSIGYNAFINCSTLTTVTISGYVNFIDSYAFYGCTGLTSIVIFDPDETILVYENVFSGCTALTDVWFEGSDRSDFDFRTGNDRLIMATWHYNSCMKNEGAWTHVYDNACDTTCNACGDIRTVPDHVYSNDCDNDCNECGDIRTVPDHVYSTDCDNDCNECGAVREVVHVYDFDCDRTCNVCGETRKAHHVYDGLGDLFCNICGQICVTDLVSTSISLTVEERIYVNVWLEASGIEDYKALTGKDFEFTATVNIDGKKHTIGSGVAKGKPVETEYGSYYIFRLAALPANHFDKTLEIVGSTFVMNTVGDEVLNILNLAKAGANAGFDQKYTNLFKALYNYGASNVGKSLLDLAKDFLKEDAADPVAGIRDNADVRFTGMYLLMGDAVGIRLAGNVVGNHENLSVKIKIGDKEIANPHYSKKVDPETGKLTLDLYFSAENFKTMLDITVLTGDTPIVRVRTSIKGYAEYAKRNNDSRTLALAQLVQACTDFDAATVLVPDKLENELIPEAGEIIF